MKLQPDQLTANLAKDIRPVYLISGDEQFLCQEAVRTICSKANERGYSEKTHCLLEKDNDMEQFIEQSTTGSLFADKRILSLQLISGTIATKPAKALTKLIHVLDNSMILIISAPKLSPATSKSVWVQAAEKTGVWVQVWPMKDSQFSAWLHNRLRSYGGSINPDAMNMLSEMCSGNLLAADQQVKKLALMYQDRLITTEMLYENGTDNSRFDIFQIIDFALLANTDKLLHGYHRFSNQDRFKANELLNSVQLQLRQLLALSECRDRGENLIVASQKIRLWSARQKVFFQVLPRLSSQMILSLLRLCARIDQQIRGERTSAGIKDSLLALLLVLAGKKTPQLQELIIELPT